MQIAQHRDHAKLLQPAQIALGLQTDGGQWTIHLQRQGDVFRQQPMVATPARHGQPETGC